MPATHPRILYVDDSRMDRELVRYALVKEPGGFELVEAGSREEFEERLQEGSYDLVLSDFNILGYDGFDVIDTVWEKDPAIPVVIVTGTGSEEIAVTAMKRGAADYVIKTPHHVQRLPHIINSVLETQYWTQRRRLAERELKYHANLLKNVSDAVISTDVEMNIESWNRAAEKIYGWREDEVRGKQVEELLQTEFSAAAMEGLDDEEGNAKGFWRGEVVQRRKDGTAMPILASVSPLNDDRGQLIGWVMVNRDISRRLRAELRYRSMFDAVADAVLLLDPEETIFDANPAAWKMYACTREELIGQSMRSFLAPEGHALLDAAFEALARQQPFLAETVAVRRDGTTFEGELRLSPFSFYSERHVLVLLRDITERKRLEKEILEVSGREQRRIGRDLHDGLGQQLAAIGFRMADLERALEEEQSLEAEQAAELGDMIRQAMNHARALAHGLNPMNLEDQDFDEALRELTEKVARHFKVTCIFTCPHPIPFKDRNAALHVYRILQEALNNAIRHGKATRIEVTLEHYDQAMTLTVRDNGAGFVPPPKTHQGMGLHIMDYRARMINGNFEIKADAAGGTLVRCSFQASPSPANAVHTLH
jgi:PAS domain S-box-containing protein